MICRENNFAFIDSQNLNLGVRDLGWRLDFKKFRIFLAEKHDVTKACLFLGYLPENSSLYASLQEDGYEIIFETVTRFADGTIKGNVDAELVLRAMADYSIYDRAVIVSNDGDFKCLVEYLKERNKFAKLISPNKRKCSSLLKEIAWNNMVFLDNCRHIVEFI